MALGLWPWAVSKPRAQFFLIQTDKSQQITFFFSLNKTAKINIDYQ